MIRLAVLASGRGTNLQAILDAIDARALDARVVGVFSDRPDAQALQRARAADINALGLRPRDFASRLDYDAALFDAVDAAAPHLVVCAGYMRLIGEPALAARAGRLINIHPSLLPAFKGLHTHRHALAAGATEHGASVHFVTPELDGGPVIAQVRVPVREDDDEHRLARRVLRREHPLLLATLREFAAGRIAFNDGRVYRDGAPLPRPLLLDDHDCLAP